MHRCNHAIMERKALQGEAGAFPLCKKKKKKEKILHVLAKTILKIWAEVS